MSIRFLVGVAVLSGAVAVVGCSNPVPSQRKPSAPPPGTVEFTPNTTAAVEPHGKILDPIVVRDCLLTVKSKEDVPTQRDGVIVKILVKEGEEVKAGQLLAQLDDRLAVADRDSKKAKVISSEAKLGAAKKTKEEAMKRADISRDLFNKKAIPYDQFRLDELTRDRYIAEEVSAEQDVVFAKLEHEQSEIVLKYYQIRSDIPGVVKTIIKQPGEAVKNLDTLFQVNGLDRLRAEGLVDIQYLPRLQRAKKLRAVLEYSRQDSHELPLVGHLQEVTSVAVSKDPANPLIISASTDSTVRVWDRKTRQQRAVLPHPVFVRAVACTGPGAKDNWCASAAGDGKARIWDLSAQPIKLLSTMQAENGHRGALTTVVFSPDGTMCATGGEDKDVCIWESATGKLIQKLPTVHRGSITSLQWPVAGELVSAAQDNTVAVWKVESGKPNPAELVRQLPAARSGDVTQLGTSPDGKSVLFDQGRVLRVLSLTDGSTEAILQNPLGAANFTTFALFSPNGKLILTTGGSGGRLQLWRSPDAQTRPFEIRQLVSHEKSTCAAFAPDSSFLVTGTRDRQVLIWPVPTAKEDIERVVNAEVTLVESDVQSSGKQVRVWAEVDNPRLDVTNRLLQPGTAVTVVIYDE